MLRRQLPLFTGALVSLALLLLSPLIQSSQDTITTVTEVTTYIHLYTDGLGVSHFRVRELEFQPLDDPNAPPSLTALELDKVTGATLLKLKQGAVEDWHTAPNKQLVIIIQGEVEVTASDGEVRRLSPGDIMLMDDLSGKGHITNNVSGGDHIALMIPVPADWPD